MDPEKTPKDLLVMIWVHGFKGNEVTFESFPERLSHMLQATHPSLRVESHVFPAYQTRGELSAAVLAFVDWLTELIVRLECDHGVGGGAGKAKIVLMGHSMGGLLIADAAKDIVDNSRPGDPLWPKIVGIFAFDTPYLGLHPHTFKHHLSQAASYYEQARSVASAATMLSPIAVGLGWGKWGSSSTQEPSPKGKEKQKETQSESFWSKSSTLYGLGAVALGAAAGTAYYRREDFMNGWKWGFDHMTFVKNLWDDAAMKQRLDTLDRLEEERDITFWNFYTHLPATPPKQTLARTFTILPTTSHVSRWRPSSNTLATDEVAAHMGMFAPKTNDGFYDLGLAVAKEIGERIQQEGVASVNEMERDGWKEEKDANGRSVWVET